MVENGARMYGTIRVNNIAAIGADTLPGADLADNYVDQQKATVNGPVNVGGSELI